VLGFLDLIGAPLSPVSYMLALADILVLVVLMANRPWFQRPGQDVSRH
jgi:hypothetical protein